MAVQNTGCLLIAMPYLLVPANAIRIFCRNGGVLLVKAESWQLCSSSRRVKSLWI